MTFKRLLNNTPHRTLPLPTGDRIPPMQAISVDTRKFEGSEVFQAWRRSGAVSVEEIPEKEQKKQKKAMARDSGPRVTQLPTINDMSDEHLIEEIRGLGGRPRESWDRAKIEEEYTRLRADKATSQE